MKDNIKKRWIKALRSGKFRQGCGALRSSDGHYCCLGVLCELHRRASKTKAQWTSRNHYFGSWTSLPEEVMEWAGLDSTDPFIANECGPVRLSDFNDQYLATFERIADEIEKQL